MSAESKCSDILVVDDEKDIRNLVQGILQDEGYKTRQAESSSGAYKEISAAEPALIILDIWLQGSDQDGLEILKNVKKNHPHVPIIMISGHGTIEMAVAAIKEGAYDFIEKPFKADRLLLMVKRALEAASLRRENAVLKGEAQQSLSLVGESQAVQNLQHTLERVAPTNSRVLLTGEPGSGKNVAAGIIHHASARKGKAFLTLNCATLTPERFESILFGESKDGGREGILERAHGGTLFLDEVSDMPLKTQGKIVRLLQEPRFQKVGGQHIVEVDVRVIASTNQDLEQAVKAGTFREDLLYRLSVVPVHVPPLRERVQDIPAFVDVFSKKISHQSGLPVCAFSAEALGALQECTWPGNLRQLHNVVEWVMIMNSGNVKDDLYEIKHLPPELKGDFQTLEGGHIHSFSHYALMDMPLREAREEFERKYLLSQVERFDGNVSKTAQFVGMERSALHRKLKSLQIIGGDKDDSSQDSLEAKRKMA